MVCVICAYYSLRTSDVPGMVQQSIRLPVALVYEVQSSPHSEFSWSAKILVDESPIALKTLFKGKNDEILRRDFYIFLLPAVIAGCASRGNVNNNSRCALFENKIYYIDFRKSIMTGTELVLI